MVINIQDTGLQRYVVETLLVPIPSLPALSFPLAAH
jgi:hypothetical protein